MIIIVDERTTVTEAYKSSFEREGVTVAGFGGLEFNDWFQSAGGHDLSAVESFLLGDFPGRERAARAVKARTGAAVIAISESAGLDSTLNLFAAGADDVVRKPVHAREIIARIGAIKRRTVPPARHAEMGDLRISFDGSDPEIAGRVFMLPRRERRILEYLAANRNRRVSRAQIFGAVYGLFDEEVEESVVESHISKLRKKLRHILGYDPIDTKRYLGYQLIGPSEASRPQAPQNESDNPEEPELSRETRAAAAA